MTEIQKIEFTYENVIYILSNIRASYVGIMINDTYWRISCHYHYDR